MHVADPCSAPLDPPHLRPAVVNVLVEVAEHRAHVVWAWRRAKVDRLRVVLRPCRDGGQRSRLLLGRKLLRLVVNEHVVGLASRQRVGARGEADKTAVLEFDGLLAVGLAHGEQQVVKLRLVLVLEWP